MSKKMWILLVLIGLIFAVFIFDYLMRCHGKPLTREEALKRADAKLQRFSRKFVVGDTIPKLVEERYDSQKQEWMFAFDNSTCSLIIVADRCHGTDIGGVSKGCTVR